MDVVLEAAEGLAGFGKVKAEVEGTSLRTVTSFTGAELPGMSQMRKIWCMET